MAKRNDDKDFTRSLGCMILLTICIAVITIVSIIIQLIPLVVPAIFLLSLIGVFCIYVDTDKKNILRKFQLTEREQNQLNDLDYKLNWAYEKLRSCKREIEVRGLRINKDGRVSQRSYAGQDVQGAIDNANSIINECSAHHRKLINQPVAQWKIARGHYAKLLGFLFATTTWLCVMFGNTNDTFKNFGIYVKNIRNTASEGASTIFELWTHYKDSTKSSKHLEKTSSTEKVNITDHFASVLWKAMFIMLVVYAVVWLIGFITFGAKYHKPPLATITSR